MNLVVTGTGMLGSRIVYRLLEEGLPVRTFVRPNSNFHPLQAAGAEIVFGDLLEPDTFPAALNGVERVIASATAPMMERHLPEACNAVDGRGIQDLIDASKKAGVKQFVFTGGFFSLQDKLPLSKAKAATMEYLKQSGLNYTILKLEKFTEVWIGFMIGSQLQNGPKVTIVGDGNVRHSFVSMENVLDLIVAVLGHPAAQNAVLPIGSPDKYTYREVIALVGRLTGMEIEINSIRPEDPFPGMPPVVNELWEWVNEAGDSTLDASYLTHTFGIKLFTVEESLKQMFSVPVS
jgi:uncharacterized protein YbjT (DUF2867 family)